MNSDFIHNMFIFIYMGDTTQWTTLCCYDGNSCQRDHDFC